MSGRSCHWCDNIRLYYQHICYIIGFNYSILPVVADLQVFVRTFVMYPANLYKICSNPFHDKEKEIMCML
jgi:hypothetical protein